MVGWFGLFTRVTQPRCGYCLKAPVWRPPVLYGLSLFTLTFDSSPIKGEGIWLCRDCCFVKSCVHALFLCGGCPINLNG